MQEHEAEHREKSGNTCIKNIQFVYYTIKFGGHIVNPLDFFILRKHDIQTFCYCVSLSCFVWIYNLTVMIVSQKYQELSLQVVKY